MDQTAARSPNRRPVVFRDGLGRRCRVPDAAGNEKLEILCLRGELTVSEHFEPALRERVTRLASFQSPEFSRLKTVERLRDATSTLVLVSETTNGVRLADLLTIAERGGFRPDGTSAWCLTRQLVSAIAALHEEAADVAHGAIAAERIVITPEARLVVVESALGAALKHVRLSHEQLWKELRVACPRSATAAPLDHRADITQIGIVALSLVLGRALRDDEYPSQVSRLLDAAASANGGEPMAASLRSWLARALQLEGRKSFASAIEASALLDEALEDSDCTLNPADLEEFLARCREEGDSVKPAAPAEPAASDKSSGEKGEKVAVAAKPVEALRVETAATKAAAATSDAEEPTEIASAPTRAIKPSAAPAPAKPIPAAAAAKNPVLQFPMAPAPTTDEKASETETPKKPETDAGTLFGSVSAPPVESSGWKKTAAAAVLLTLISGAGWAAASHYFDVRAEPGDAAPIASKATTPTSQFERAAVPSVSSALSPDPAKVQPEAVKPGEPVATTATALTPGSTTPAPSAPVGPVAPPSGWMTVTAPSEVQVFESG